MGHFYEGNGSWLVALIIFALIILPGIYTKLKEEGKRNE